jgi:Ca2+/H+ antiporter, TMEM165/GDT1 family
VQSNHSDIHHQNELVTDLPAKSMPAIDPQTAGEDATHLVPSEPNPPKESKGAIEDLKGFRREFLMAFGTIFLAELGDKTQLSTLLMTAESQSPWIVFAGAATALITTSLLGVVIGRWLARYLSPQALKTATGASLLFIAILLIWDTVHL